jgi:hypothetical protein
MFQSASSSVNGKVINQSGNTAIADTGTTLALVSDEVCKAIYAAIPNSTYDSTQQGYTFPANTPVASLPVVEFAVGDTLFAVQKEDLGFADAGNGMVYGGIQSRGTMTFDILGDTFLKGIYAVSSIRRDCAIFICANRNTDLRPGQYPLWSCATTRADSKYCYSPLVLTLESEVDFVMKYFYGHA